VLPTHPNSAMINDVKDESTGEVEWGPQVSKEIGRRAAQLYKSFLRNDIGCRNAYPRVHLL